MVQNRKKNKTLQLLRDYFLTYIKDFPTS